MKLKEYISKLEEILEKHGNVECISDEASQYTTYLMEGPRPAFSDDIGTSTWSDLDVYTDIDDKVVNCVIIN